MNTLAGRRILVVEDEFLVAAMVEDALLDLEAVVVGPAATLAEGLRLAARETLDLAILDVNLNGERSDAIADALTARNIPFIRATGYGEAAGRRYGATVLDKPYSVERLVAALERLIAASS
jgi:DNA-binding response OmpR family regulator